MPSLTVLNLFISTMVNDTLLNFGKRYQDDLRVIFDQWPKLHLGLDAKNNQKILNGIYSIGNIRAIIHIEPLGKSNLQY